VASGSGSYWYLVASCSWYPLVVGGKW
jgi:hypothetical protein